MIKEIACLLAIASKNKTITGYLNNFNNKTSSNMLNNSIDNERSNIVNKRFPDKSSFFVDTYVSCDSLEDQNDGHGDAVSDVSLYW